MRTAFVTVLFLTALAAASVAPTASALICPEVAELVCVVVNPTEETVEDCVPLTGLPGCTDLDGDGVPDAVEPTLCYLEDEEEAADGTCDAHGTDYTPPR